MQLNKGLPSSFQAEVGKTVFGTQPTFSSIGRVCFHASIITYSNSAFV